MQKFGSLWPPARRLWSDAPFIPADVFALATFQVCWSVPSIFPASRDNNACHVTTAVNIKFAIDSSKMFWITVWNVDLMVISSSTHASVISCFFSKHSVVISCSNSIHSSVFPSPPQSIARSFTPRPQSMHGSFPSPQSIGGSFPSPSQSISLSFPSTLQSIRRSFSPRPQCIRRSLLSPPP